MPATRLTVLTPLVVLVLAVAACGNDEGALSTDATAPSTTATTPDPQPTTSLPATTAVTSTSDRSTTSTAPPTSNPVPATDGGSSSGSGDPTVTCPGDGARRADLDGDGLDDTVVHRFDPDIGAAVLEVCLAGTSGGLRIDGVGQAQGLDLADVTGDGRPEIFYSATAALFRSTQIARVIDGGLVSVTTPGGGPLVLIDGYPDGTPPDGARRAFGCAPGTTGQRLADATVQIAADGSARVTVTRWSLEGASAAMLDESTTTVGEPGGTTLGPEVLATVAAELVAEHTPPC